MSVLVVDPDELVRRELQHGLRDRSDVKIVASAADGQSAVEGYRRLLPDVVLMDLLLSEGNGRLVIGRIVAEHPRARVVVHTALTGAQHVLGAFDAGAVGYLIKGLQPQELVVAIHEAARGGSPVSAKAAAVLVTERRRQRLESALTQRQREVLELVAEGMTNRAIAEFLHITEKTVKVHMTRILETLRVPNRTQAALWARTQRAAE